jgi:hypothetical protein
MRAKQLAIAAVFAIGALLLGGVSGARAAVYDLTACNNYCGPAGTVYGTVGVDETSSSSWTVTFTLTYPGGWVIADPDNASVGLDITGATGVTIGSGTTTPGNWNTPVVSSPAAGDIDGQDGNFLDYALCKSGDTCGTVVVLDVTGSNLAIGTNSDNYFAAIDVVTGDPQDSVWATGDVAATPLPATLPLFAGGLGFVGYLGRRRKQIAKQALAAA